MKAEKYNDKWLFWEEKDAFALIWNIPEQAEEVTLPHDAMIAHDPDPKSLNKASTGFRDGGIYCYVKHLHVEEDKKDKHLLMKFEGVYMNTFVYINGELAAKRPYGYSTFYVELDPYIKFGESNEIRVFVRNGAMTNSRWYPGSGIYRDVYLLEGDRCHISEDGLKISTNYVQEDYALMDVKCHIKNKRPASVDVRLTTVLKDPKGNIVGQSSIPVKLYEGEDRDIQVKIGVKNPALWDAENPTLYTCSCVLKEGEGVMDSLESKFGIRTLMLDAVNGLRVNAKTVKLRGACIHHDSGILGAATYDQVQYRQIKRLKEAGFNAIRMAHNPMAQSMLRACDQLGMYVMDEAFDMWSRCKSDYDYAMNFEEWHERDLQAMVAKDFNHPSVIMYSLGNEIPELGNRYGVHLSSKMSEIVKSLDPTRYTLISINGVFAAGDHAGEIVKDVSAELVEEGILEGNVNDFMALMADHMDRIVNHHHITSVLDYACPTTDIAGYNYMAPRYIVDGDNYPNRIIVGSETYPGEIGVNWQIIEKAPHVIGDFTWTGWDYIGEAGVGIPAYAFGEGGFGAQFPCQLAYCGDFDLIGNRRPASYYREIAFGLRKEPYIVVTNPYQDQDKLMKTPWIISDSLPVWDYTIEEGSLVTVEIYAPGDEVELVLNGESMGRVSSGPKVNYMSRMDVPYGKGSVTAIVYENQREISRQTLSSLGEVKALTVSVDVDKDFVFAEIALTDGEGRKIYHREDLLDITLEGDVELLGFGSGDPKSTYGYKGFKTSTYQGSALAVFRKTKEAGQGKVIIHSEKYGPSEFKL